MPAEDKARKPPSAPPGPLDRKALQVCGVPAQTPADRLAHLGHDNVRGRGE